MIEIPSPVGALRSVVPMHEIRSLRFSPLAVGKDGEHLPSGEPQRFAYIGESLVTRDRADHHVIKHKHIFHPHVTHMHDLHV